MAFIKIRLGAFVFIVFLLLKKSVFSTFGVFFKVFALICVWILCEMIKLFLLKIIHVFEECLGFFFKLQK